MQINIFVPSYGRVAQFWLALTGISWFCTAAWLWVVFLQTLSPLLPCFFKHPLWSVPPQPKQTAHIKMNGRTGIFATMPDLVWLRPKCPMNSHMTVGFIEADRNCHWNHLYCKVWQTKLSTKCTFSASVCTRVLLGEKVSLFSPGGDPSDLSKVWTLGMWERGRKKGRKKSREELEMDCEELRLNSCFLFSSHFSSR